MIGEYRHTVDSKGRLFVPAKIREELGDSFYITLSVDKCLSLYDENNWRRFLDKIESMPYNKQRRMRPLFAYAAKCEPDSQGRILLPANLRSFAGIIKDVAVIGCNNHVELWDSEAWDEVSAAETTPEYISSVMKELDF